MPPEHGSHDGIDREGPRIRPDRRAVMRQDWHHLLFLHWPVPPEPLRAQLPPGLELDLFEGSAYVGLTPFTLTNVRPVGVPPLPFVSRFHETNVRTYVHAGGRDPGVWFFSLDASNPLAVMAARTVLGLPYKTARISLSIKGDAPVIDYLLQRRRPGLTPASFAGRYQPRGPVVPAAPGSLEFFLVERYVLYNTVRGRLYRQRIHHEPWPLQAADFWGLEETLLAAAGIPRPDGVPLAHYGRAVHVEVFPVEWIESGRG